MRQELLKELEEKGVTVDYTGLDRLHLIPEAKKSELWMVRIKNKYKWIGSAFCCGLDFCSDGKVWMYYEYYNPEEESFFDFFNKMVEKSDGKQKPEDLLVMLDFDAYTSIYGKSPLEV